MVTLLNNIMILLAVIVVAIMIPRLMIDWLRFREGLSCSDGESIRTLISSQNGWAVKHSVSAAAALAMVTSIHYLPELAVYRDLAASIAIYGMISLCLAVVELLMVQHFESFRADLQPVRQEIRDLGR